MQRGINVESLYDLFFFRFLVGCFHGFHLKQMPEIPSITKMQKDLNTLL
jgi:hypothetical protein